MSDPVPLTSGHIRTVLPRSAESKLTDAERQMIQNNFATIKQLIANIEAALAS